MMRESGAAEKPLRPDGVAPKAGANLDRPERHDAQPARSPQPRGAARLGYPDDLQRARNRRPGAARDRLYPPAAGRLLSGDEAGRRLRADGDDPLARAASARPGERQPDPPRLLRAHRRRAAAEPRGDPGHRSFDAPREGADRSLEAAGLLG